MTLSQVTFPIIDMQEPDGRYKVFKYIQCLTISRTPFDILYLPAESFCEFQRHCVFPERVANGAYVKANLAENISAR